MRWPFTRQRAAVAERLDPQSAYALWADAYPPRPHNPLMACEQHTLLSMLPDVRGQIVLDAGCGTGRYLEQVTLRGARAIGVDLSMAMLARARSHRVARADLRALPIATASVDLVICGLALGDVDELDAALNEMARVTRPGGAVIYSVVHPAGEAAGWSRTFESEGRYVAIDGYWHSVDKHRSACSNAGLAIDEWREPQLAEAPGRRAILAVRARR